MASELTTTVLGPALETCRGLECLIGKGRFGVPVEFVQQVVELEVGLAPPLSLPWVGGVGLHEGRALVSIALLPSPGPAKRSVKGVWLTLGGSPTDFVLEVTRVASFVEARVQQKVVSIGGLRLPSYVTAAFTSASRSIGWVHVAAMLHELAGVG